MPRSSATFERTQAPEDDVLGFIDYNAVHDVYVPRITQIFSGLRDRDVIGRLTDSHHVIPELLEYNRSGEFTDDQIDRYLARHDVNPYIVPRPGSEEETWQAGLAKEARGHLITQLETAAVKPALLAVFDDRLRRATPQHTKKLFAELEMLKPTRSPEGTWQFAERLVEKFYGTPVSNAELRQRYASAFAFIGRHDERPFDIKTTGQTGVTLPQLKEAVKQEREAQMLRDPNPRSSLQKHAPLLRALGEEYELEVAVSDQQPAVTRTFGFLGRKARETTQSTVTIVRAKGGEIPKSVARAGAIATVGGAVVIGAPGFGSVAHAAENNPGTSVSVPAVSISLQQSAEIAPPAINLEDVAANANLAKPTSTSSTGGSISAPTGPTALSGLFDIHVGTGGETDGSVSAAPGVSNLLAPPTEATPSQSQSVPKPKGSVAQQAHQLEKQHTQQETAITYNAHAQAAFKLMRKDPNVYVRRAATLMELEMKRGANSVGAAGMAGNARVESYILPDTHQLGGTAQDYFQHDGARLQKLKDEAARQGKNYLDPDFQLDFSFKEMKDGSQGGNILNEINDDPNAYVSALDFEMGFERAGAPALDKRGVAAETYHKAFLHYYSLAGGTATHSTPHAAKPKSSVVVPPIQVPGVGSGESPSTPNTDPSGGGLQSLLGGLGSISIGGSGGSSSPQAPSGGAISGGGDVIGSVAPIVATPSAPSQGGSQGLGGLLGSPDSGNAQPSSDANAAVKAIEAAAPPVSSLPNSANIVRTEIKQYGGVSGKLKQTQLEYLGPQWPGAELAPAAADGFRALNAAFKAQFGHDIQITDWYRSYPEQVDVKNRKPTLAAKPGTSEHGWGFAVDFSSHINNPNSAENKWMHANAPLFGWHHPDWAEPHGSKPEPWHWEFVGSSDHLPNSS